ncbi:unnamed protein product [Periconia digitata]|uniref:glutathione transferase n=1 Tax=Periconia digitata TaxID=1303443 RepID=A0A9W4XTH3_9PLEO|nr:unnamed protein product [Periconia digitata]
MSTAKTDFNLANLPDVKYGNTSYNGVPIIYVVKASKTSYINYMKVLMLAEELNLSYEVSIVSTKDEWYHAVHPERYVPAIKDRDAKTLEYFFVFESTACLQYLVDAYDKTGTWSGRTQKEKALVTAWLAYQTAGIGLYENCVKQWGILEKRLAEPGQGFIALKERPTVADIAYYPFAMSYMFEFLGVNIADWPNIMNWAQKMEARPGIQKVLQWAPTIGS